MTILLAMHPSERISVQVLKSYLAEVSKTFVAITSLYKRERKFQDEETDKLIQLIKLRGLQRRAQRIQKEIDNLETEGTSDIEGKIVVNQPQLREGFSPSSEDQRIRE